MSKSPEKPIKTRKKDYFCTHHAQICIYRIDSVVFHEQPRSKSTNTIAHHLQREQCELQRIQRTWKLTIGGMGMEIPRGIAHNIHRPRTAKHQLPRYRVVSD
jgi:hypothetical protein